MQEQKEQYKPTVLIVDDMQENLMILSDILKDQYQVKVAKSGEKALLIIEQGGIDLVLLDIVMPNLDGYEVCKIVQKNPKTKQIPIIFVTANTSIQDEKKGFDVGAVDYINKPFSATTVKARVNTHMSLYLQTKKLQQYEKSLEQEVKEKTKELDKLNRSLEHKVKEELEKNRQKDVLLQQQARLAALGEMIGNIAHQWRQPLSVITTAITGLNLKSDYGMLEPSDIKNTSESVMQNAEFLSQTIDNFRNFFKKDQSKEKFFISEAIEETLDIVQAAYKNNYITISTDLQKDIDYFGSKNLLSQVFLNILSNAKDAFSEIKNKKKIVHVTLSQENDTIIVSICDNAKGVPDTIKEKIFDPYFTTKHQSQGTGIGLYMSRMILHNHFHGTIELCNNSNQESGACFIIHIKQEYDD